MIRETADQLLPHPQAIVNAPFDTPCRARRVLGHKGIRERRMKALMF